MFVKYPKAIQPKSIATTTSRTVWRSIPRFILFSICFFLVVLRLAVETRVVVSAAAAADVNASAPEFTAVAFAMKVAAIVDALSAVCGAIVATLAGIHTPAVKRATPLLAAQHVARTNVDGDDTPLAPDTLRALGASPLLVDLRHLVVGRLCLADGTRPEELGARLLAAEDSLELCDSEVGIHLGFVCCVLLIQG
jgi:hypothetical protein